MLSALRIARYHKFKRLISHSIHSQNVKTSEAKNEAAKSLNLSKLNQLHGLDGSISRQEIKTEDKLKINQESLYQKASASAVIVKKIDTFTLV